MAVRLGMVRRHVVRTVVAVAWGIVFGTAIYHGEPRLGAQNREAWRSNDPIAKLGNQIERGEAALEFRPGFGYLQALLDHLDVNVDSQLLILSKTSFQQRLISPRNPRALYFNDHVAIGTVPGGEVYELSALDPAQGLVFYTLNTRQADKPTFERRGVECLFCHSPGNHGAAGLVVASVIPDPDGTPFYLGGFFGGVDHRTPFDARWGGWYVTGTHGSQRHMGNAVAPDRDHPLDLEHSGTQNLLTIAHKIDVSKYLLPTSDIVALMTLEHQSGMTNLINSLSAQYRLAERSGAMSNDVVWRRLDEAVDELVGYMLFVDEAPLGEPVQGTSTFAKTFPRRGPRDSLGRSFRDFDLQKRLFRYPLSYMIYSDQFDAMPRLILDRVYRRLYDILTGQDAAGKFAALSAADRRAVFEILLDTKQSLPASWRPAGRGY